MNEQGFWRIMVAVALGCMAAAASAVVAAMLAVIRRKVSPEIPITAGITAAVAAYAFDWYSDRQAQRQQ